jgi:hypothetical protein
MPSKCQYKEECTNPEEEGCLLGYRELKGCPNRNHTSKEGNESTIETAEDSNLLIGWSGNSLGEVDLKTITYKKRPFIIGVIGPSNAGKTTFLAAIYLLLRNGHRINGFSFAGSNTLIGWENIAYFLTCKADNFIEFPPHTSRNAGRIPGMLHLKLIDSKNIDYDILFTDAPGEWFTTWGIKADDSNAIGAQWIDENSDAFLLFADCDAFVNNIGNARLELRSIAERLRNSNQNRAVALTWSKSDINVVPVIKDGISQRIGELFPVYNTFNISVKDEPKEKFHENILELLEWLLGFITKTNNQPIYLDIKEFNDFFFVKR